MGMEREVAEGGIEKAFINELVPRIDGGIILGSSGFPYINLASLMIIKTIIITK
jgi:hypothetical protein